VVAESVGGLESARLVERAAKSVRLGERAVRSPEDAEPEEDNLFYVYSIMAAHRTHLVRVENAEVGKTYDYLGRATAESRFRPPSELINKEIISSPSADKPHLVGLKGRYLLTFRQPLKTILGRRTVDPSERTWKVEAYGIDFLDEIRDQSGGRRKRKTRRKRKQRKSRKRMRGGSPVAWADVSGSCKGNNYDENGNVLGIISHDTIDDAKFYRASDEACYDIDNLCQWIKTGRMSSPITRGLLTKADQDACAASDLGPIVPEPELVWRGTHWGPPPVLPQGGRKSRRRHKKRKTRRTRKQKNRRGRRTRRR